MVIWNIAWMLFQRSGKRGWILQHLSKFTCRIKISLNVKTSSGYLSPLTSRNYLLLNPVEYLLVNPKSKVWILLPSTNNYYCLKIGTNVQLWSECLSPVISREYFRDFRPAYLERDAPPGGIPLKRFLLKILKKSFYNVYNIYTNFITIYLMV